MKRKSIPEPPPTSPPPVAAGPPDRESEGSRGRPTRASEPLLLGLALALIAVVATGLLAIGPALAQPGVEGLQRVDPGVLQWGYTMTAAVTAISSLAAAYAVARVGTAAVGALAEKPELFGRMVVLVGLAEGIAIYGLIVSILILNHLPG